MLADGDEPGEAAAADGARRWKREGRRVRIARPPQGQDFNDLLLGRVTRSRGARHMRATEEMQIADIIEAAEEVTDPLDNLVERTADDPGIPFQPDVLARLCELKRQDQAAFERLRARLRKCGLPRNRTR